MKKSRKSKKIRQRKNATKERSRGWRRRRRWRRRRSALPHKTSGGKQGKQSSVFVCEGVGVEMLWSEWVDACIILKVGVVVVGGRVG